MRDSIGHRTGFTASGASKHEERTFGMEDGFPLIGIEAIQAEGHSIGSTRNPSRFQCFVKRFFQTGSVTRFVPFEACHSAIGPSIATFAGMNLRAVSALIYTLAFPLCFLFCASLTSSNNLHAGSLSDFERDRLRYKLETLFNEQDLMVRNQKSDRSDLNRQQREFEVLKVLQRIPFKEEIAGLRSELNASAREKKLKVLSFQPLPRTQRANPQLPDSVYTDQQPRFRLNDQQLVETISFRVTVEGEEGSVKEWIASWPDDQMRLTEAEGAPRPRKGGKNRWSIRARAFRFRDIKFPSLKARDPKELLPQWARRDPESFARQEPLLWRLVEKIHAVAPKARPLYRQREDLILNSQRMSFFVSKAVPHPGRRQAAGQAR